MTSRAAAGDGRGSAAAMCREIQRLEIAFKEPMATFKAGDLLSGSVQMDIVQEFKLKGASHLPLLVIDRVKVLRLTRHKMDNFGTALLSQSLN